jgi:hypothetical protein
MSAGMQTLTKRVTRVLIVVGGCLFLPCCSSKVDVSTTFTPGLGEIMALQQVRHAKLWLAGSAGNWELATYECDELEEGFVDAVHFHPTHKTSPQPLTTVIPQYMEASLKDVRVAVDAEDVAKFESAYDKLTSSCNGCHQATGFGFNVVVRPTSNTFANQDFAAPKK